MFVPTQRRKKDISRSFIIVKSFPRRRCKGKCFTDIAKRDIRRMARSLQYDLRNLKAEYAKMICAVEDTIYEKLIGLAFKARALERFVIDSKIPTNDVITLEDGTEEKIAKVCVNTLQDICLFSWDLPLKYTDAIIEITADKNSIHWSKISRYMPENKPLNLLDDLYSKLSSATAYFREEVCRSCGWSVNTFFGRKGNRVRLNRRRVAGQPLTEAEAERILSIFKETIIPALLNTCEAWEQNLKAQRKEVMCLQ